MYVSGRTASQRQQRHDWSSYAPSQVDSGLVANIQKLFSERIEIFAPVEFSKVSILTGIIKISLKVGRRPGAVDGYGACHARRRYVR